MGLLLPVLGVGLCQGINPTGSSEVPDPSLPSSSSPCRDGAGEATGWGMLGTWGRGMLGCAHPQNHFAGDEIPVEDRARIHGQGGIWSIPALCQYQGLRGQRVQGAAGRRCCRKGMAGRAHLSMLAVAQGPAKDLRNL